jgi:hypothetical protein
MRYDYGGLKQLSESAGGECAGRLFNIRAFALSYSLTGNETFRPSDEAMADTSCLTAILTVGFSRRTLRREIDLEEVFSPDKGPGRGKGQPPA